MREMVEETVSSAAEALRRAASCERRSETELAMMGCHTNATPQHVNSEQGPVPRCSVLVGAGEGTHRGRERRQGFVAVEEDVQHACDVEIRQRRATAVVARVRLWVRAGVTGRRAGAPRPQLASAQPDRPAQGGRHVKRWSCTHVRELGVLVEAADCAAVVVFLLPPARGRFSS
jgi:hypothetical protein